MDLADILLWTFSFVLAILGIIFGLTAAMQSSKANRRIQELISSSWANDETQRLFFDNIKTVSLNSNQCITLLESKKKLTYREYAMNSAQGRLIPLSGRVMEIIAQTEFRDLAQTYLEVKKGLDDLFFTVIGDFSLLSENTEIPADVKAKLIKYHQEVIQNSKAIIRSYNHILGSTEQVTLK